MNINEIAINTIQSNTVKQYLITINHNFSLSEQIALIYYSDLELTKKLEIFNYIKNKPDTTEDIRKELSDMVINIKNLYYYLKSNECVLLLYDEDKEPIIIKNVSKLKELVDNRKELESKVITNKAYLIDVNSSTTLYELYLNKTLDITDFYGYCNESEYIKTSIQDTYVDIPNTFKVGDLVHIVDDDNKWVVVYESKIPEKLREKAEFLDASITVVPESIFDKNISYIEQINDIFKKRINTLDIDENDLDIISKYHKHFIITILEKVEAEEI